MSPFLFMFDDKVAQSWDPYLLTRPAGELLFGALLLRERGEAYWQTTCRGHLTREGLSDFEEDGAPPCVSAPDLPRNEYRVFHSSRAVLTGSAPPLPGRAATLVMDGAVVGWMVPPGVASPPMEGFLEPGPLEGSETVEVEGEILTGPWDLMARNGDQLRTDIPDLFSLGTVRELPGSHILGDGVVSMGHDVVVEPGSVFDATDGPIRLSDGVRVRCHTRLAGPAFVGPGSSVLGGVLSEVSLGPVCKVRGEVESTIVLGYTNKAHDGFLGHAYLGRWVNLGAFTTNSDLKNNYGLIRIGGPDGPRETGLMKVGCFLGDHVKTGIGTLLNTGTVVGAGSNLFGGRMPPTWVPPFSWGSGEDLTEYRLEKFLEVAVKVMKRRGVRLTAGSASLLQEAWESTRAQRSMGR